MDRYTYIVRDDTINNTVSYPTLPSVSLLESKERVDKSFTCPQIERCSTHYSWYVYEAKRAPPIRQCVCEVQRLASRCVRHVECCVWRHDILCTAYPIPHTTTHYYTTPHTTTHYYTTPHTTTLYLTPLHTTTLHLTLLRYTSHHYTLLHYTSHHYTLLHYTSHHYSTPPYTTHHHTTISIYHLTLHHYTLHNTPPHYTTLHLTSHHTT